MFVSCFICYYFLKLVLEKAEETEIKIANIRWIMEKAREFQKKNIYFCFIDYTKTFDYVDHNKLRKILKRRKYQMTLPASWETCIQVKKQQLESDTEHWTDSKLGKEYIKAILSPCLFNLYTEYFMGNTGLDEAQAGSRLPGELSITSDTQMTPPLWQKVKRN